MTLRTERLPARGAFLLSGLVCALALGAGEARAISVSTGGPYTVTQGSGVTLTATVSLTGAETFGILGNYTWNVGGLIVGGAYAGPLLTGAAPTASIPLTLTALDLAGLGLGTVGVSFSIDGAAAFPFVGGPFNAAGNSLTINAVPEPGTWALLGLGLTGAALRRRRARAGPAPG